MDNVKERNKNYYRIEKMIAVSYLRLCKKKDKEYISVSELCKDAKVNRTTFYKHYRGVWQINETIEDYALQKIDSIIGNIEWKKFCENPEILLKDINAKVEENASLLEIALTQDDNNFLFNKFSKIIEARILNCKNIPDSFKNSVDGRIRIIYFTGGLIYAYKKWFTSKTDINLDQVAHTLGEVLKSDIICNYKKHGF